MRLALALFLTAGMVFSQSDPIAAIPKGRKLIVVTTSEWGGLQGTLARYERRVTENGISGTEKSKTKTITEEWQRVGKPVPVVVGRNGLAWDPALARGHADLYLGPVKREGDGRSPAGIFPLDRGVFGFEPSLEGSRRYMQLIPTIECVDDPASQHYAQIVDRARVDQVDWRSSEKMRSVPGYRWGVVVNYNMDNPVRGDGSCIFLHQWSGPDSGTAGCTAMAADDIEVVLQWLKDEDDALMVQLPKSEYERLRGSWGLP